MRANNSHSDASRSLKTGLRNRDKWDDYRASVGDMVDRTSTEIAPWTLVEANDKRWARVKVLRTINRALEDAFDKSDKHDKKGKKK